MSWLPTCTLVISSGFAVNTDRCNWYSKRENGETCNEGLIGDKHCKSNHCACSVTDNCRCWPYLEQRESCEFDRQCNSGQCTCNRCVGSDGLVYPGGPCRLDSQCQSSHYCNWASGVGCTGTCVEKLGITEKCTFDDRCDSGQCTCNRCVGSDGLVYPGGPCRVNSQCQSSYFCSGFTAGSVCSGACEYKLANGISCNRVRYGHDQCQSDWCYCWFGSCSCRAQ